MPLLVNIYAVLLYMIKDKNSGATLLTNPPDYMPSGKRLIPLCFSFLFCEVRFTEEERPVKKVAVKLKCNLPTAL